jgi:hypothetical protein
MTFLLRINASIRLALLLALLLTNNAQADLFAPSLLKIVETTQHDYNVVWKTPSQTTSNTPLQPTWPNSCEVTSESPAVREGTVTLSSWPLRCDQLRDSGLVQQTLGITGLANQAKPGAAISHPRLYSRRAVCDATVFGDCHIAM